MPIRCFGETPASAVKGIPDCVETLQRNADLEFIRDNSLTTEQYILTISDKSSIPLSIRSATDLGATFALRTLVQLLQYFKQDIPCLVIEDYPVFPVRGVMLDVSRCRVPRMDELLGLVRKLAGWKINHLQLYTEHTFRYRGHAEVWRGASPLTPGEIRRLDEECRSLGITLAANQNCFGHMERWLKHPRYASLAETQGDWEWDGRRLPGPFSLCPLDPGSLNLIDDLLGQLLPNFTSGLVNIGCDETLDVGQGRSSEEVARIGRGAVYFDFVEKIVNLVKMREFRPLFWADIALSHPEECHRIPPEMISLAWGYEPDAPFAEWCGRLRETGSEVWVCPGTSSWRSITGRTTERRGNIRAAVEQGLDNGAAGFLMTDWGDEGHRQQYPVSLIGLAEAADASWSVKPDQVSNETLDFHAFDNAGGVTAWLNELGDVDLPLRNIYGRTTGQSPVRLRNASALYVELQRKNEEFPPVEDLGSKWTEVLMRIRDISGRFPCVGSQTSDELSLTLEVAGLAASIAVKRFNPNSIEFNNRHIVSRFKNVIAQHRRLWRLRSRPGGLEESTGYYYKVIERVGKEFR